MNFAGGLRAAFPEPSIHIPAATPAIFMESHTDRSDSGAEDIHFSSSLELANLSAQMAGRARRHLDIASRSLEPAVYEAKEFLAAVQKLVVSGRGRARVRILVFDPEALLSRGDHRLVNLAMRVSSYIEIRRPGPDHQEFNEAMLIADRTAVIHRRQSDRYDGVANFHSPLRAAHLSESFEAVWQNAEPDPHFRRLML